MVAGCNFCAYGEGITSKHSGGNAMSLAGRSALVSGGSRGIGQGIALAFAKAGADVAINYRRDEESAQETVAQIQAMGRKSVALQGDASDYERVKQVVAQAIEALGKIDILVSSAGIASRGRYVVDSEVAEFHRVIDTHAFSALHFAKEVIPHMRQHRRGDIMFISSVGAEACRAGGAPYAMAKCAMEALAKTLAKEERPRGIRVNVIRPGLVETEMGRRLAKARFGVDDIRDLYATSAFGRVCQPYDIGNLAVFLASEEGEYITGQIIAVSGGE